MPRTSTFAFTTALAACALALASAAPAQEPPAGYAIEHLRAIDGTGAPAREDLTLVVRGQRILSLDAGPAPEGMAVIDGRGLTALPGLIDAHVHVSSVPGAAIRGDSPETVARMRRAQLRAYVACGVTTVLDAAAPTDGLAWVRAHAAAGDAAPRVLMLAPFLTPAGGYFASADLRGDAYAELWEPIDGPERVRAELDAVAGWPDVVGVKVTVETGFGPFDVWPTWSPEMRRTIRAEAEARGMPIFAHSMTDANHRLALELAPRALMHAGYADAPPTRETLRRMGVQGVTVVSTLSVYDAFVVRYEPERLADPLTQLVVPAEQLATAADPDAWKQVVRAVVAIGSPGWVPGFVHPLAARLFLSERAVRAQLASAIDAVRAMHAAGIPIVAGTDAGTWPVMTSGFHGATLSRELELLVEAGLTPLEAIEAATSRAAALLGIDDDAGTLEAGKRADVLLVDGDPSAEIGALRRPVYVIHDGAMRTPAEWMVPAAARAAAP